MLNTKFNKADYIFIVIYSIIFLLLNGYDFITDYDTRIYEFSDGTIIQNTYPPLKGYFIALPIELLCTLLVVYLFFTWLIPKYLIQYKKYLLFFFLAVLLALTFGVITHITWHWSENKPWQIYPTSIMQIILNGIGLSAENGGFALGILLAKKYFEGQLHVRQIQKQQRESELKLLKAQLTPHFLFNNLNTLDALIPPTSVKAKEYITGLSSLYRYLIETKDEEIVSLQQETEMVKHYFYLIKTRFGDAYQFNINQNNLDNDKFLPTGALQILIENVVKHNKTTNENPVVTTINIQNETITVTNVKTHIKTEIKSFGTGLKNLKERYRLLFDKTITIDDNQKEFKVTIPVVTLKPYE